MALHQRSDTYPMYFPVDSSSVNHQWMKDEIHIPSSYLSGKIIKLSLSAEEVCKSGTCYCNKHSFMLESGKCHLENDQPVEFRLNTSDLVANCDQKESGDTLSYAEALVLNHQTNGYDVYNSPQDTSQCHPKEVSAVSVEQRLKEKIARAYKGLLNCSRESCNNLSCNIITSSMKDRESESQSIKVQSQIKDTVHSFESISLSSRTWMQSPTPINSYQDSYGQCLLGTSGLNATHDEDEKQRQLCHSSGVPPRKVCFPSVLPFPISRKISAQLWAIQVAEGKHSSSPKLPFVHVVLLAKVFRIWYLKLRVQRLIKEEGNENYMRATEMYNNRLLLKCFIALRAFTQARKRRRSKIDKNGGGKRLTTSDLRQKGSKLKRAYLIRLATKCFHKWQDMHRRARELQLDNAPGMETHGNASSQGVKHLENSPENSILMSQVYVRWKQRYSQDQKEGIATLHFKIHLLYKTVVQWRMFTIDRRVKNRMADVARIHTEQYLLKKSFRKWKNAASQICFAKRQTSKSLLRRSFQAWRTRAMFIRVLRQRCVTSIKGSYGHKLLIDGFGRWKKETLVLTFSRKLQMKETRRMFMMWFLKYRKNLLHRKLYRAQARKARKKRFFLIWQKYTTECKERREKFQKCLINFQLRVCVQQWKCETNKSTKVRDLASTLQMQVNLKTIRKHFSYWKLLERASRLRKKSLSCWSNRAVRKAAEIWKGKVVDKKLTAILNFREHIFDELRLQAAFHTWKTEYHVLKRNNLRALAVKCILDKGKLARAFVSWQIVTQEDCMISSLLLRVQRRQMARAFDSWRCIVVRKTVSSKFREIKTRNFLSQHFSLWRSRFSKRKRSRELIAKNERLVLEKLTSHWKDFAHDKIKRRKDLATKYGKLWLAHASSKIEEREKTRASEARSLVLKSSCWRTWKKRLLRQTKKRERMENLADKFCTQRIHVAPFKHWKRQHLIHIIIRLYPVSTGAPILLGGKLNARKQHQRKLKRILSTAFAAWRNFVKIELQQSISGFKNKLQDHYFSNGSSTLNTSSSSFRGTGLSASGIFGSAPNLHSATPNIQSPRIATVKTLQGHSGSLPRNWQRTGGFQRPYSPLSMSDSFRPMIRRSPRSIQSQGTLRSDDQIIMSPVIVPPRFSQTPPVSLNSDESIHLRGSSSIGSQSPPEKPEVLKRTLPFICTQKSFDDDTMMTSGIHTYSGYEEDDSDDETMSCTSYQTQNDSYSNYNRETFVSDTLRHWKFLPISITFRAWLKYTQERRMHREFFFHFVEKKNQRFLQKFFYLWHREAYCKIVAEQFKRRNCLSKGIVALAEFASYRKTHQSGTLVAELHHRNSRLRLTFFKWKKKYVGKRKILHLVNRWQNAAVSSDHQKEICNQFQLQNGKRMLAEMLLTWKRAKEKSCLAKEFWEIKTLGSVMKTWHDYASKRRCNAIKMRQYLLRTSVKKYYYAWQDQLQRSRVAAENGKVVQRNSVMRIIRSWQAYAQKRKTELATKEEFENVCERRLLAKCFYQWHAEKIRFQEAAQHADGVLLQRVFMAWQFYSDGKIDIKLKMRCFWKAEGIALLQINFQLWKKLTKAVQFQRRRQADSNRKTIHKLFVKWRLSAFELRVRQSIRKKTLALAFCSWRKKCSELQKRQAVTRKAFIKWRSFTEGSKAKETVAIDFFRHKEHCNLKATFELWHDTVVCLNNARSSYKGKLTRRILADWRRKTERLQNLRSAQIEVANIIKRKKIARCLSVWFTEYKRKSRVEQVLQNYTELKKQEMLQLCLYNFKMNAMKSKATKFRRMKVLTQVLAQWHSTGIRQNTLRRIRRNLLRISIRGKIRSWRTKIQAISDGKGRADDSFERKQKALLRKIFADWLSKARKQGIAKDWYKRKALERCLTAWKLNATKAIQTRSSLQEFSERQRVRQVSHLFLAWKARLNASEEERRRDQVRSVIAVEHYRKRTLEVIFLAWRNEVILEKILLKRRNRIARKYLKQWRTNSIVDNGAKYLYEQKMYEKYWCLWRKYMIKNQVTKAMQDHHKKTLLSEAFTAWHGYSFLRRTILKQMDIARLRKYFRRWMQRYNSS